jgi:hypothetical protein
MFADSPNEIKADRKGAESFPPIALFLARTSSRFFDLI